MAGRSAKAGLIVVGCAYRSSIDGLVRWVSHESARGVLHLLRLDEEQGVWYGAGLVRRSEAESEHFRERVPLEPKPGSSYRVCSPAGVIRERERPGATG